MKVIVAGSTTWQDKDSIRDELSALPADSIVIHGDSPGADRLGRQIAQDLDLAVEPMAKS